MKIKHLTYPLAAISLMLFLISCSQRVTLDVLVEEPLNVTDLPQPIKLYLLNEKDTYEIEQIRAHNSTAVRNSVVLAQDSLRRLYRDYLFNEIIYKQLKSEIETKKNKLAIDYRRNLTVELIQVKKLENIWNFSIRIKNDGPEIVDGIYFSLDFNKDKLVTSEYIPLEIQPHQTIVGNKINLDLSRNFSLSYRLSSYPGGLNKLPEVITCRIDSVQSQFSAYLAEGTQKLNYQKHITEEIGLLIDDFPNEKCHELQYLVADPINQILENNLNRVGSPLIANAFFDTVHFQDLKPGKYSLIAYTTPTDTLQWHQVIDIQSNQLIKFTSQNPHPFFIRITEAMFSYRPFQDEELPEKK